VNKHEKHLHKQHMKKREQRLAYLTQKLSRTPKPFSDDCYERPELERELKQLREELDSGGLSDG